jgi:hypothetical protein
VLFQQGFETGLFLKGMVGAEEYLLLGIIETLFNEILDFVGLGLDLGELMDFFEAKFAQVDGGFLDVN